MQAWQSFLRRPHSRQAGGSSGQAGVLRTTTGLLCTKLPTQRCSLSLNDPGGALMPTSGLHSSTTTIVRFSPARHKSAHRKQVSKGSSPLRDTIGCTHLDRLVRATRDQPVNGECVSKGQPRVSLCAERTACPSDRTSNRRYPPRHRANRAVGDLPRIGTAGPSCNPTT